MTVESSLLDYDPNTSSLSVYYEMEKMTMLKCGWDCTVYINKAAKRQNMSMGEGSCLLKKTKQNCDDMTRTGQYY